MLSLEYGKREASEYRCTPHFACLHNRSSPHPKPTSVMESLERICTKYTQREGERGISAVVAGYTNAQETKFITAKGYKSIETKEPATIDSMMCLFSCTKSMTAMSILILRERGMVDLDVPAKQYLPILGDFGIIDEEDHVDERSGTLLRPPRKPSREVTIKNLLLHNSGFAYIFTDSNYLNIMTKRGVHAGAPLSELFTPEIMPLTFEPGTSWNYGHGSDWCGLIVEAVSGLKLSEFLEKNVFLKSGMTSCTFHMRDPSSLIQLCTRRGDDLKPMKRPPVPYKSPIDMGGQGCFGTVNDYLKFMRIWLNYGTSPDTGDKILSKESVQFAIENHLPKDQRMTFYMPSADISDGYSLAGCAYSTKGANTGRPVSSLYWAGLANLYFWMDFENSIAGFWGCQILPFLDESCVDGFVEFETEVYSIIGPSQHHL